jgi:hypothetical protein
MSVDGAYPAPRPRPPELTRPRRGGGQCALHDVPATVYVACMEDDPAAAAHALLQVCTAMLTDIRHHAGWLTSCVSVGAGERDQVLASVDPLAAASANAAAPLSTAVVVGGSHVYV